LPVSFSHPERTAADGTVQLGLSGMTTLLKSSSDFINSSKALFWATPPHTTKFS